MNKQDILIKAYKSAINDMNAAYINFQNADPDFATVAALEYETKRRKVGRIYQQLKRRVKVEI